MSGRAVHDPDHVAVSKCINDSGSRVTGVVNCLRSIGVIVSVWGQVNVTKHIDSTLIRHHRFGH
jgi:hypothetical protein